MKTIAKLFIFLLRVLKRINMLIMIPAFKKHGRKFIFDPTDFFSYSNIEIGNYVSIGKGATFLASESKIIIGDKVLFGPNVTIVGGNHNTSVVGKFIYDVLEKRDIDDQDIIIEDDIWVGSNVVILKGVRLFRGCVIGAGSVVTKDIPPYSIALGVPAKVKSFRFSPEEILFHEEKLYPLDKRYSLSEMKNFLEKI